MASFKPPLDMDNEDTLTEASTVVGCDSDITNSPFDLPSSSQRVHWLIVHGQIRITRTSLLEAGIRADGCHSTVGDDGRLITYIHLSARCRQSVISKHLTKVFDDDYRVVEAANDKSMANTLEFQFLARHMGERHVDFVTDGSALGLLSRFAKSCCSVPAPRKPSRLELENAELRQRIACMEQDWMRMEQRLSAAHQERLRIEDEMDFLRQALSKADDDRIELKRLRIENTEFRRLGADVKEVRRLNRELLTLQDHLDAKSRDCKVLEMTLRIAREDNARLERAMGSAPLSVVKRRGLLNESTQ